MVSSEKRAKESLTARKKGRENQLDFQTHSAHCCHATEAEQSPLIRHAGITHIPKYIHHSRELNTWHFTLIGTR